MQTPAARPSAAQVSHGNTANAAKEFGDEILADMCGHVASDESRHEIAYTRIVDKLFERDADGAMMAFGDMMRKQIVMPAHLMDDLEHADKVGVGAMHPATGRPPARHPSAFERCDVRC